jgi:hypothetical protein
MSKQILCRIDPEEMVLYCANEYGTWGDCIIKYLTAHAVPEAQAPLILGGVEEVWGWANEQGWVFGKDAIKQLLDRFGIQWDEAPDWADRANIWWADKSQGMYSGISIPRPTPTIEDQRRQAIEALAGADAETVRKVLEVLNE